MVNVLCWLAGAAWLGFAPTVFSQFNTTVNFTLTSLDPMVDLDGRSRIAALDYDEATGYRTADFNRYEERYFWFVGTAFKMRGVATYKENYLSDVNTSEPARLQAYLGYPSTPTTKILKQFNSDYSDPENISNDPSVLVAGSSLELAAYELRLRLIQYATYEFHNVTVSVPIRTQA